MVNTKNSRGGLKIAVLIKQIPKFEEMSMTADGCLVREGIALEMNAYCRRAVAQGITLARDNGGRCTAFTLGPATAEDVLREAIACGADAGVLISDPAFAGSDTLATARALAAALAREGPFDLILAGRNSVDAETGQVPPALAELLGLPFVCAVRRLKLKDRSLRLDCERDDGWLEVEVTPPAVLGVAERLCSPAKAAPEARRAVAASRLRTLTAAALGPGPWGQAGSPTRVGEIRSLKVTRRRRVLSGETGKQVRDAVAVLVSSKALEAGVRPPRRPVPPAVTEDGAGVGVILESERERLNRELCGTAALLARAIGGHVTGLMTTPLKSADLGAWGVDEGVLFPYGIDEEDAAAAIVPWAEETLPWALLAPGTLWGRAVAARLAARLNAGLTGDAIDLEAQDGRLIAWKPAFGGQCVAAITATSAIQMATVRAGALPLLEPRKAVATLTTRTVPGRQRVRVLGQRKDDDIDALAGARSVVGVGTGVAHEEYDRLRPLTEALGATLAATRKVTDWGWLPRARQLGITGQAIAPNLYVAVGLSGKFNHSVGIRGAGTVLAINNDPQAPIFGFADIGIVGDWKEVVPRLVAGIEEARQTCRYGRPV